MNELTNEQKVEKLQEQVVERLQNYFTKHNLTYRQLHERAPATDGVLNRIVKHGIAPQSIFTLHQLSAWLDYAEIEEYQKEPFDLFLEHHEAQHHSDLFASNEIIKLIKGSAKTEHLQRTAVIEQTENAVMGYDFKTAFDLINQVKGWQDPYYDLVATKLTGCAEFARGNWDTALSNLLPNYKTWRKANHHKHMLDTGQRIATIWVHRHNDDLPESLMMQLVESARIRRDIRAMSYIYLCWGQSSMAKRDFNGTRKLLDRSLRLAEQSESPLKICSVYDAFGDLSLLEGSVQEARNWYYLMWLVARHGDVIPSVHRWTPLDERLGTSSAKLAYTHHLKGDSRLAETLIREAVELCDDTESTSRIEAYAIASLIIGRDYLEEAKRLMDEQKQYAKRIWIERADGQDDSQC